MFKKYKKILILCISLITLVGCNNYYHGAHSSININSDLSGTVSLSFVFSTSEDDETFNRSQAESLFDTKIAESGRFKDSFTKSFSDTDIYIQYEEQFHNLDELKGILERISGKEVSLYHKVSETEISTTHELEGMPTDDLFFTEWVYDLIEEEQLFGDLSNSIRSEATDSLYITWEDEYFDTGPVLIEKAPALSQLKQNTTFYKDKETSYEFILGFEDASIVDAYQRLLIDDMETLYSGRFKVSSKEHIVTVELLKGNWDDAELSTYLYGIQLAYPSSDLVDYMDKYSALGAEGLENYIGTKDVDEIIVFPVSLYKTKFRLTEDAVSERTITFNGLDYIAAANSFGFNKTNVSVVNSNTISILDDNASIAVLVSEKENSFNLFASGPWLPLIGGIGIGIASCLLILFIIKRKNPSKHSKDSEPSPEERIDLGIENAIESTSNQDVLTDEVSDIEHQELRNKEIVTVEDSMSDELHDQHENESTNLWKHLSECLKNRISLYFKAFTKPETYITTILTALCLVGMVVLFTYVGPYALKSIITSIPELDPYIDSSLLSSIKPSTDYLAQALSLLISKATMSITLFEFTYQAPSILPIVLLIFPGLWLSKTLCRFLLKSEYAKESAYITMTLLIIGLVIASFFKISISDITIHFNTLSIFTLTLPIILIVLYLMFEKKTELMKRTLTKSLIIFVLIILLCIAYAIHYKLPAISFLSILNLLVLSLTLYPFGLFQAKFSGGFFGSYAYQLNVIQLVTSNVYGFLLLLVIMLLVLFVFMDIRQMYKKQERLSGTWYSVVFSTALSLALMAITQLGTIAFDLSAITLTIGAPWFSMLLTFIFNFLLSYTILVVLKTEKESKRSKLMIKIDGFITTIQNWIFK